MANTFSTTGLIILLRDVSGSMHDSEDAKEAFNSSLERTIASCAKGDDWFNRPFKIGVVLYHRYNACEYIGFADEYHDQGWKEWIKTYEPDPGTTTNIVGAYKTARDWAVKHQSEFPKSCIVIMNITDGEHTESYTKIAFTRHEANVIDDTTVNDVADEILALDHQNSGDTSLEGRCILGYLWYGHTSPSFPTDNPPVKCSRIPTQFIRALRRKNPKIIERNGGLTSKPPPYFFMSPDNYAKISDFIEIGTTTHVQGYDDEDDEDDDFIFDEMYEN